MKRLQIMALMVLLTYGGFMTGYLINHPAPEPVAPALALDKPLPVVDWQKFYYAAKLKDVHIRVGVYFDPLVWSEWALPDEYKLYIDDGKEWHLIAERTQHHIPHIPRIRPTERNIQSRVRYAEIDISEMKKDLPGIPPKNAKFIVIGQRNPQIYELTLSYGKEGN